MVTIIVIQVSYLHIDNFFSAHTGGGQEHHNGLVSIASRRSIQVARLSMSWMYFWDRGLVTRRILRGRFKPLVGSKNGL